MTHDRLVFIANKWLRKHSKNIDIPNCPITAADLSTATSSGEKPDVIGWCYWASVLIEVKVSRADFLRDKNKPFRVLEDMGMGQFRYYCTPKGLIKPDEIPNGWGLLYCGANNQIEVIQMAERKESNLVCERTVLLSIIRRQTKKK